MAAGELHISKETVSISEGKTEGMRNKEVDVCDWKKRKYGVKVVKKKLRKSFWLKRKSEFKRKH